jgi:hypothetical protein
VLDAITARLGADPSEVRALNFLPEPAGDQEVSEVRALTFLPEPADDQEVTGAGGTYVLINCFEFL